MENEEIEIKVLLEAIRLKYGYDFSGYADASLTRRIHKCLAETGLKQISHMIPKIIHDKSFFSSFLHNLTVNVTEMFRDPLFFLSLRQEVIPYLKTFPFIKVWSAGISTGEEVYSLAILLKEEGLYEKSRIYATDFNDTVLEAAQKGIYPIGSVKNSIVNYQKSGGRESFANYYHSDEDSVIFNRSLKENIVFANHNVVTDGVFGEMNLILCRNVLIYFNRELKEKVLQLFSDSLRANGFLCLGSKESIDFSSISGEFKPIVRKRRIFQKKITIQPEERR